MKIARFIICLLFGLMFINAGLNKFFNYMSTPEMTEVQQKNFEAFMEIGWILPLIATVEVLGGLLFIIPKTRALGAIMILPIMVGIILQHFTKIPEGKEIALVLGIINLWVLIENRHKYAEMWK